LHLSEIAKLTHSTNGLMLLKTFLSRCICQYLSN